MSKIEILKSELKSLDQQFRKIKSIAPEKRGDFGKQLNVKKQAILEQITQLQQAALDADVQPLDITAPCAPNQPLPDLLTVDQGSRHPLMTEMDRIIAIYQLMGFNIVESRQLDDEFHMFDSLNFEPDHPARGDYDTFRTEEGFIPPAHTSTMQHRVLKSYKGQLEQGHPIAVAVPGRVYRNEDIDVTHEHTLYQCEGVYVSKSCNLGQMLGILSEFFARYFGQTLKIRTQPGFFPFTEPSLELLIEKPQELGGKGAGWLEMLGMGMIHPNVLRIAGIDPDKYKGFAWGGGIDRLVMLKYHLRDIRHLESGRLRFLKEFR